MLAADMLSQQPTFMAVICSARAPLRLGRNPSSLAVAQHLFEEFMRKPPTSLLFLYVDGLQQHSVVSAQLHIKLPNQAKAHDHWASLLPSLHE